MINNDLLDMFKEQAYYEEKIKEIIENNLKWYDLMLYKINPKLVKHHINLSYRSGDWRLQYVEVYGKKYFFSPYKNN